MGHGWKRQYRNGIRHYLVSRRQERTSPLVRGARPSKRPGEQWVLRIIPDSSRGPCQLGVVNHVTNLYVEGMVVVMNGEYQRLYAQVRAQGVYVGESTVRPMGKLLQRILDKDWGNERVTHACCDESEDQGPPLASRMRYSHGCGHDCETAKSQLIRGGKYGAKSSGTR